MTKDRLRCSKGTVQPSEPGEPSDRVGETINERHIRQTVARAIG